MRITRGTTLAAGTTLLCLLTACGAPPPAAPPPSGPGSLITPASTPVTTTTAAPPAFDIVIRPVGQVPPEVLAVFSTAERRWEQIVAADVPDSAAIGFDGCLDAGPTGPIDDLVIDVEVTTIDGTGDILGSAGPCALGSDGLPRAGQMWFDEADFTAMLSSGLLLPVVLHEMGHVLGIGTVWGNTLVTGRGTDDPRYIGLGAVAAWIGLGRSGSVPVENTGGSGTQDSHWRESEFANELMTGRISGVSNPMSSVTIASLADIGYQVDLGRADPFTPPSPLIAPALRASGEDVGAHEVLVGPDRVL